MSIAPNDFVPQIPFPVRTFSVQEYHRLGELGILTEDDRVELLSGWIVPKVIHNPLHDAAVELADDESLRKQLPDGWRIRIQSAITTNDSEPEPDLAIVQGSIRDHLERHPEANEIALLIEVADSSVQRDRLKAAIYARAGVQCYWIVNLPLGQLETYTDPNRDEERFQSHETLDASQTASVIVGETSIAITVQDLLP